MSDVKKRFDMSAQMVKNINTNFLQNDKLLTLYGLYKQGTCGNCNIPNPNSFLDLKANEKWKSWNALKGMSKTDAMNKYSDYVMALIDKYGLK